MTLSVWRYAHLLLALISSVILVIAAVTGVILAVDAVDERTAPYRVDGFDTISLVHTLDILEGKYSEVSELTVDHNHFVSIKAYDHDGEDVHAYIDPSTGEVLGYPKPKSNFIQWVTAFHRSLFLKESGRLIIGVCAFLLMLITVSGTALILQRQKGIRNFFVKIVKEDFAQYFHVVTGRLALIPIFILALSGTYLCLDGFHLFEPEAVTLPEPIIGEEEPVKIPITEFPAFANILLKDVDKISFPFFEDPEEFYTLKLTNRELVVDQFSGVLLQETYYPFSKILATISMDLHTGRTSILWAVVLGVASLNILFFLYSGFAITLKRRSTGIKNKFKPTESEYILLVGSENGSTLTFANAIHQQLMGLKIKSYLTELNSYSCFPEAKHLVVFTSTHGLGDAPANAKKFTTLVEKHQQQQTIQTSVVGFGSYAYPDFCGYAKTIDTLLTDQPWANQLLGLHMVNDKSTEQFAVWVKQWSEKTSVPLSTTPSRYVSSSIKTKEAIVAEKTAVSEEDQIFSITLRSKFRSRFTSGDLLAIYPGDGLERLYSIAKMRSGIQLLVKFYEGGIGSQYLNKLAPGSTIPVRIIPNPSFHFPKAAPVVAMICNGTGIAPFLGMIDQHKGKTDIHIFAGFRKRTQSILHYENVLREQQRITKLKNFSLVFSREEEPGYVMDLIREQSTFFSTLVKQGGTIMICGSLAMQRDVEILLNEIFVASTEKGIEHYREKGMILTDCY